MKGLPGQKLSRLQDDLEQYVVEEFESLATEMTLAEPDSQQKRNAQEYWTMLAGTAARGYFRSSVGVYRSGEEGSGDFAEELRALFWRASGEVDEYGVVPFVGEHKHRRKMDLEEGNARIILERQGQSGKFCAAVKLQRFRERSGKYHDESTICVTGISFLSDWTVEHGKVRKTLKEALGEVIESDIFLVVSLPWAPPLERIPTELIDWVQSLSETGRKVILFSPAAFGALFSLATRGIVPDDCFVEVVGDHVTDGLSVVGVESVNEYVSTMAENIPAAIREKLLRHFEVM